MKHFRDLHIVRRTARPFANCAEFEPDHVLIQIQHLDFAILDIDGTACFGTRAAGSEFVEIPFEQFPGARRHRRVIQGGLLKTAQAIVHRRIEFDDRAIFLQQGNSGQEALALQAVFVQLAGRNIRRGDQDHLAPEQGVEQPAEQHRIADIRNEKLIETNHPRLGRNFRRHFLQRVLHSLQGRETPVNPLHKGMKMHAHLV